jgi:hypothetical protein
MPSRQLPNNAAAQRSKRRTTYMELTIEDLEMLARRGTSDTPEGSPVTLDPLVVGFVAGDIHTPCEKVEFRRVSGVS